MARTRSRIYDIPKRRGFLLLQDFFQPVLDMSQVGTKIDYTCDFFSYSKAWLYIVPLVTKSYSRDKQTVLSIRQGTYTGLCMGISCLGRPFDSDDADRPPAFAPLQHSRRCSSLGLPGREHPPSHSKAKNKNKCWVLFRTSLETKKKIYIDKRAKRSKS